MTKDLSFLKIGEAAKALGVSIDTLRRWEKAGKIQSYRTPGGTRQYPISEIERVRSADMPISRSSDEPADIAQLAPQNWRNYLSSTTPNSPKKSIGASENRDFFVFSERSDFENQKKPIERALRTDQTSSPSNLHHINKAFAMISCAALVLTSLIYTLNLYQNRSSYQTTEPALISNLPSAILAEANARGLLQVNGDAEIKGSVTAQKFNDLTLRALDTGFSIATQSGSLTVTGDVSLDQDLTTTSSPSFVDLTVTNLTSSGTSTLNTANISTATISTASVGNLTITNILNLGRLSSDPSSAVNGATYYNTTSNKFRCYVNGTWANCDTDTTGGSMSSFTLAGTSGTSQTISDGNTLTIAAGSGITTTAASTDTVTIAIDATSTSTTTTTTANSGLEVSSDGLRLLGGCSDGQVLQWVAATALWTCTTASSGISGSGSANNIAKWSSSSALTTSGITDDGTTITLAETTLNLSSGTASRFLSLDSSKNAVYTALSSVLLNTLSDEVGTGVAVFGTSPTITTSLLTDSTTFALANTTATTINFAGAATTALNIGNGSGNYTSIAIGSGSGTHTIDIAGTGATGADTINIGSGGTGADTITLGSTASTTSLGLNAGSGGITLTNATTTVTTFSSSTSGADSLAIKPQSATTTNAFTGTITTADLTVGAQTFTIPNLAAATSDTFCMATLANCTGAGGGSGVTYTSQTTNALTKFTSTTGQITSSTIVDDGTATLTITPTSGTTETLTVATATTLNLFNTQATTVNLGGAATTALNIGNGNTAYTAINIGSGTGGNVLNIAGTGATGADTINIGSGGTGADTITLGSTASSTSLGLNAGSGGITLTNATTTVTTFSSSTSGADSLAIKPQSATTTNAFTGTITTADLTVGAQTFTIPNLAAATSDTFCMATLANCTGAGGGSGVTYTSQTTNALTKFTSTTGQITSSTIVDDGTATLTITPTSGTTETLAVATATTLNLFNTQATTVSAFGAATTLNLATTDSVTRTINLGTGSGADTINIGTGGTTADTITIGNATSSTSLALTSGTGSQTHTSSVATGTTTTSAFVFTDAALSSGTGIYDTSSSITTGRLLDIATTGNTWTGNSTTNGLVNLASTSTAGTTNNILLNLARSGANANSSVTSYGEYLSVTNTGTTSTNVAGYFTASGGTTANYALQVGAGDVRVENTGALLGSFTTNSIYLPVARARASTVVANGYVYVLGGEDGTARTSVYYAKLNNDGSIGSWTTSSNSLPLTRNEHTSIVANGYIYVMGGGSTVGATFQSTIYFAKVNTDGSVGSFVTTVYLPGLSSRAAAASANGYVYVLGGSTGSVQSTVYFAKQNSDGSLGTFTTNAVYLPVVNRGLAAVVANGYIYAIGGSSNAGAASYSSIYYASLNADGTTGAWTTNTSFLPTSKWIHNAVVASGYLYALGGDDSGAAARSIIYYGKLQSNGSVAAFSTSSISLPLVRDLASSIVANGYIYVLGGSNDTGTTPVSTVFYTPLQRTSLAGDLDLLGQNNANLGLATGDSSNGSVGGSIYAGNEFLAGTLEVTSNAQFWNGLSVNGPSTHYTTYGASALTINHDGNTGTWQQATTYLSVARSQGPSVVANGYIYVIGGTDGTIRTSVYYAKLNNDGTLGTWTTNSAATNLPAARSRHTSLVANGYIYVIGGTSGSTQSTVLYAKLNSDGTMGTWTTNSVYLPLVRELHSSVVANGYVYVIGGENTAAGGDQSTVYFAKLNSDGSVGTFNTNANYLPLVRGQHTSVVANGYVYVIGGSADGGTNGLSTVYYASLNADGTTGTWTTNTNYLPANRFVETALIANGYLYVVGGAATSGSFASSVFYAKINNDGSVGAFSTSNSGLPGNRFWHMSVVANGYIYALGGSSGSHQSTVFYAPLPKVSISGDLDLLGLNGANLGLATGDSSTGSVGSNIYAGNAFLAGTLEVTSNAQFWNGLSVNGPATHYVTNGASSLTINHDGNTGAWQQQTAFLPVARMSTSTSVANGYVYLSGGADASAIMSSVYYAKLNNDGTLGTWTTNSNSIPAARWLTSSAVANGYIYVLGGATNLSGNTPHTSVYYAKVNSDGTVGVFSTNTNSIPAIRENHTTVVANGYIYVLGGHNGVGGAGQSTVYYAKLNSDGSVGSFTTNAVYLPVSRWGASSFVANGYVYVVGGRDDSAIRSSVYYAPLNADGTIGAFSANSSGLPGARRSHSTVVANGYIYVVGGNDGSARSSVYYAKINNDGTIGAFSTSNFGLPLVKDVTSTVVANGYVYALGGSPDLGVTAQSTAYYAPLPKVSISGDLDLLGLNGANLGLATGDSSTGSVGSNIYAGNEFLAGTLEVTSNAQFWNGVSVNGPSTHYVTNGASALTINHDGNTGAWQATATLLPVARNGQTSVVANGYIYAVGGLGTASALASTVYYTKISNDGTIGTFTTNTNYLPGARNYHSSIIANGYLYVFGGGTTADATAQSTVLYAKLNSDGSTGTWSTNSAYLPAIRREQSSVVANGYVYVIGGTDADGNTPQSTVLYAKLNSNGTVGTWTTNTVYLPAATRFHSSIVANGYVYVIGVGGTSAAYQSAIYYAALSLNGTVGAFTSTNSLPAVRAQATPVIANGYLYIMGGNSAATTATSSVYYAKINNDGTLGVLSTSTYGLTGVRGRHSSVVANGYIYVLGGNSDGDTNTVQSTVFYAPLPKVSISGDLDLLGLNGANLGLATGDSSTGSPGSNIYAGNEFLAGTLEVTSNAQFWNGLSVNGPITQYATNGASSLTINNDGQTGAWQTNTNYLAAGGAGALRNFLSATTANGYVYVTGGDVAATPQSTIIYAKLNNDGTIGTFSTTVFLPVSRRNHGSAAYNGYIYVVGGQGATGTDTTDRTSVYYAKINSDGTVASWNTSVNSLPLARSQFSPSLAIANGYMYVAAGSNGTVSVSTVYYAKINSDGSIGSFTTNTNYLPLARQNITTTVANGYIYVIGGQDLAANFSSVYYAALNADGSTGTWTTSSNSLPAIRRAHSAFVANGYIYVMGGLVAGSGTPSTVVAFAKINNDGSTGTWANANNGLPTTLQNMATVVANGYVYAIGGRTNNTTADQSTIYYAPLPKVSISGDLDLLGLNGANVGNSTGDSSFGSAGSNLYAGNIFGAGSLEISGNTQLWAGLGVQGITALGTSTDNMALSVINSSTGVTGTTATNLNVAGAMIQSTDLDTISLLVRNTNTGTITMTNVGTAGAQGDPGVLTIEGAGDTTTVYNLITAYNSLTRSDAAAVFRVLADGNVYGEAAFNASGADYAEYFASNDTTLEPGELVITENPIATESAVARSNTPYDQKLVGIISTKPGFIGNNSQNKGENDPQFKLVAISGRTPAKVSTENGPIEVGDYLTSSSIQGVAMKATHPGQVVGKALEAYSDAEIGKIMAFVNISFADPGNIFANLIIDSDGNLVVPKIKTSQLTIGPLDSDVLGTSSSEPSGLSSGVTGSAIDVAAKLHTIDSDLIGIDEFIATQSATLANFNDNIASQSAALASLKEKINALEASSSAALNLTSPETLQASGSATLANLDVTNTFSALKVNISDTLKVLGETILAKTNIVGDLTIDGTFSIANGSELNALPDLHIQSSPLAQSIDFFNGKVTIDKEGLLTTTKLAISDKTLNTSTLPAGQTSLVIPTDQISLESKIFISAHRPVSIAVTDKNVAEHSFTVEIADPLSFDLIFDWWIVDSKELTSN